MCNLYFRKGVKSTPHGKKEGRKSGTVVSYKMLQSPGLNMLNPLRSGMYRVRIDVICSKTRKGTRDKKVIKITLRANENYFC